MRSTVSLSPLLNMSSVVPLTCPRPSSLADDFATPSSPALVCMLLDMALCFFLELNLVPVIVECDDSVDWVTELRHKQKGVDSIDDIFGGSIQRPVTIQDRMADTSMAVNVRMVDGCDEACFWWRHWVFVAHLQVKEESTTRVRTIWRSYISQHACRCREKIVSWGMN